MHDTSEAELADPAPEEGTTEIADVIPAADDGAAVGDAEAMAGDVPMSKNALKRKRKQEERLAHRAEWRQAQKEHAKERKRRRHELLQTDPAARSEHERRKEEEKQRRRQQRDVNVRILLDCEFDELMTEAEIKSMEKQITRCYADNRQAQQRCRLVVSGLNGRLARRFEANGNMHTRWTKVKFFGRPYLVDLPQGASDAERSASAHKLGESRYDVVDSIPHNSLTYLSADAEETLTTLEEGQTYIIGGIVDHNRYKNLCLEKARRQGIRCARLPIGDYIEVSGRKVLTVNQVNEIMLKWLEYRDWQKAFEAVIPKRKLIGHEDSPAAEQLTAVAEGEAGSHDGMDPANAEATTGGATDHEPELEAASEAELQPEPDTPVAT